MGPVWITGAGGLIGAALVRTAPEFAAGRILRALARRDLDLTDAPTLRKRFHDEHPSLVIHCAALSKNPECQANPTLARKLNVEVTTALAELAADIPMIFISTDLVFDGRTGNYDESASTGPLGVYAETKVEAEKTVLANPRHTVFRTSMNGGTSPTGDRAFNEQMRRAWQAGETLDLFIDEFRCPIAAVVTARAIWELAAVNQPGLYHLAGSERLSRWEIGQLLAKRWAHLNPKMRPTSRAAYRGAPRPADTSLNCSKLQNLLSFRLPGLTEWLAAHSQEEF